MDNNIPTPNLSKFEQNKSYNLSTFLEHKALLAILILVIITLAGVVFYLLTYSNKKVEQVSTVNKITSTVTPSIKPTLNIIDTSTWKTYTDANVGVTFMYPEYVIINDNKNTSQISLSVSAEELLSIPEDLPLNMGRQDALNDKDRLEKGLGNSIIKIDSLYANESLGPLSQFEICSVNLSRKLTFYPNNYRVIISLSAPREVVTSEMPEFFTQDTTNCGNQMIWNTNKMGLFEQTLKNNLGKGTAQQWYNTFDEIVKTINISQVQPIPPITTPTSDLLIYTNKEYNFTISYPKTYKALSDKENLYGYPNGIVLLYSGGQAYDVVVEVWDTKEAYQKEYALRMADLTVKQAGGKHITLLDNTKMSENENIIASFKLLQ